MKKFLGIVSIQLMSVQTLFPVLFVNKTEHQIRAYGSSRRYESEGRENSFMYEISMYTRGYPRATRIYDGSIRSIKISRDLPLNQLTKAMYDEQFYSDFSPQVTDFLFAHPTFVINITQEKGGKFEIQPSVKELEELALKEHQTKAKPKIQETAQLP